MLSIISDSYKNKSHLGETIKMLLKTLMKKNEKRKTHLNKMCMTLTSIATFVQISLKIFYIALFLYTLNTETLIKISLVHLKH